MNTTREEGGKMQTELCVSETRQEVEVRLLVLLHFGSAVTAGAVALCCIREISSDMLASLIR